MTVILPRREVLKVLTGIIAAPAIIRAGSIMPVKNMFESLSPGVSVIEHDIIEIPEFIIFTVMLPEFGSTVYKFGINKTS